MDQEERIDALERALRDATGQRDAARRRATIQTDQAGDWRAKAEALTGRVAELEAEQDRGRWPWRRRKADPRPKPSKMPAAPSSNLGPGGFGLDRRRVAFPAVKVGALVSDPILMTILAESNVVSPGDDLAAFDAADAVVVQGEALEAADAEVQARFKAWLEAPARAPLLLIEGDRSMPLGERDVVAKRSWAGGGEGEMWSVPASFDALKFNPRREFDPAAFVAATGMSVPAGEQAIFTQAVDPDEPWMLAAAATGFPFPDESGTDDSLRRSAAVRRLAFRNNASWVVAARLLDRMGVGHEPVLPSVAGVLLSADPDRAQHAILEFADQRYEPKAMVVVCRGYPVGRLDAAKAQVEQRLAVEIISLEETVPLGRCINHAIETSPAGVLALIDEHDFHGPGYVEDAVQAGRYAGAPLVTKGAAYAYLEARGESVMVRPSLIERFYDGAPSMLGLVFDRSLWEAVRFPHRSNISSGFVEGVGVHGIRPYATTPFEFTYYHGVGGRRSEPMGETFLEGAVPAWQGYRPDLATISL